MYKNVTYQVEEGDYGMEYDYTLSKEKKLISKRRFVGYFFENNVYLDNPGFKIDDRETWESWKKKKLIK